MNEKEKIKILYLNDSLAIGGAERQGVEIVKGLNKEKYEPIIATFDQDGHFLKDLNELGIPVFSFKRKFKWDITPFWQIKKLIEQENPDILHAISMMSGFYALPIGKWLGK